MGEDGSGRNAESRNLITDAEHPRFYGRRRGRTLRRIPQSLVDRLLPKLATPDPADGPVDPAGLFAASKRAYWLEIGFGGGEHLVAQAAANPDVGLIGAEPFLTGVAACLGRVEASGVGNIRICPDDARPLMAAMPEGAMARIFVLQPDPWRKRRHADRRLIGPVGLDYIARSLADNGELRISTDDPGYQVWMLQHLRADARFEWRPERADDWRLPGADWPETRYAAKALQAGRPNLFLRLRRLPR